MTCQNSASRMYSGIDPNCEWIKGEDTNILKVEVSGFKKKQLEARVDKSKAILKIRGERNIHGNQWFRIKKTFPLPKDCEINKIKAKFEYGFLYVIVPKTSALNPTHSQNCKTTPTNRGVVRKLLKQMLVILNVVIAATLLVLVLFRRYKLVDGDIFVCHKIEQHTN